MKTTECKECGMEHELTEEALTDEETGEKLEPSEALDCVVCGGTLENTTGEQ